MTISIPVVDIMHAEEHAAAMSAPPHYADVAAAHIDPLAHFAQLGQAEGRQALAV